MNLVQLRTALVDCLGTAGSQLDGASMASFTAAEWVQST